MTETPEGEIIRKIREAERQVEEDLKRAEAEAGLLIETARTEAAREFSRAREIASGEEARAREGGGARRRGGGGRRGRARRPRRRRSATGRGASSPISRRGSPIAFSLLFPPVPAPTSPRVRSDDRSHGKDASHRAKVAQGPCRGFPPGGGNRPPGIPLLSFFAGGPAPRAGRADDEGPKPPGPARAAGRHPSPALAPAPLPVAWRVGPAAPKGRRIAGPRGRSGAARPIGRRPP